MLRRIAFFHLLRVTRRARQTRFFQGGHDLRMFQTSKVIFFCRMPPVAQVEPNGSLKRVERAAGCVSVIAGLHPVHGTGGAGGHKRHQHLTAQGEEGGEVLLPSRWQKSLQARLLLHERFKRRAFFSGRGIFRQR